MLCFCHYFSFFFFVWTFFWVNFSFFYFPFRAEQFLDFHFLFSEFEFGVGFPSRPHVFAFTKPHNVLTFPSAHVWVIFWRWWFNFFHNNAFLNLRFLAFLCLKNWYEKLWLWKRSFYWIKSAFFLVFHFCPSNCMSTPHSPPGGGGGNDLEHKTKRAHIPLSPQNHSSQ